MAIFLNLILLAFVVLLIPTAIAAYTGAPPFMTPKKAVRRMLELAQVSPSDIVYDLGCGDGQVVITADKEFGARTVGFELSPFLYWVAQAKRRLAKAKRTRISYRNFYSCNLSQANVICCFLTPRTMSWLKRKLEKERLAPGTRIVSYAFEMPGWKAKKIEKLPEVASIFLYTL